MSADLQYLVEQIAQDQARLRILVNGDEDATVVLEMRTSPSIAGLVKQRLDEISQTYYGALDEDPAEDPSGGAPTVGDFYYNTGAVNPAQQGLRIFNGVDWDAIFADASAVVYSTTTLADELDSLNSRAVYYAATKSAADALAASLPDGATVIVDRDETRSFERTRYTVASGLPTSPVDDTSFQIDDAAATPRTTQNKLREIPSIQDFWRSGDGTDYSGALQRALDSGEPVITGNGREYTVAGSHTGRGDLTLRDVKLYAPSLATNAPIIDFSGTDGTPQTLGSNLAAQSWGVTVPNGAAFTVDQYAWLESSAAFSPEATFGELVQIYSVSGNVLTFYGPTLLPYLTADTATITPVIMMSGIVFDNVSARSALSTGNQRAFIFNRCADISLNNFNGAEFDYGHLVFSRSVKARVIGGSVRRTGAVEGLDYGVVVERGCFDVEINGLSGHDMRHILTIGGSAGVSRFITADNCKGTGLLEAALDSHSACHEHTFSNGDFTFSDRASTGCDGVISQGGNPTIFNHKINGSRRHGAFWQPHVYIAAGLKIVGSISEINAVRGVAGTSGYGALVQASISGMAAVDAASMTKINSSGYDFNAGVVASAAQVRKVTIDDPKCITPALNRSVFIDANGVDVNGLEIRGGHHETADAATNPVIDLFGRNGGKVKNWRITSPHMKRGAGGAIGLRLIETENGVESGSTTENVTTKYSVDAASTGVILDRSRSSVVTVTNATYTVLAQDEYLIANRAGTVTVTLPTASANIGRELRIKTIQAQTVVSASANVAPIDDSTLGTAILPATDGAWALLKSDGTNWIIMQRGT